MIDNIKNKKILIKTYLSESGLWYLAKSLADKLSKNNDVYFVPKSKYKLDDSHPGMRRFRRFYPEPYDSNLLNNYKIINLDDTKPIGYQINNVVIKHNIDMIISFETFMPKSEWIAEVKRNKTLKVIDVPMPEWTSLRLIRSGAYSIFDEIWCLTKTCFGIFGRYSQAKSVEWDYVDRSIFMLADKGSNKFPIFYHPASVNPGFSQKNTPLVIEAFCDFYKKNNNAKLIITGKLTESDAATAKDCDGIEWVNEVISREGVAKIYQKINCIISPSKREGLGLSFFEAKACGCDIITTDIDPMNIHSKYLCKPHNYYSDESPVAFAEINKIEILNQLNKYYEDYNNVRK